MLIICRNNDAKSLSEKALNVSGTLNTEFSLKIEKQYFVYSMCLWEGVLKYLLIGEENLPSWYPAELFEVIDKTLPLEWYCNVTTGMCLEGIWGYKEMVYDDNHHDDLIERDSDAIKIFLNRKKEMEE